MTPDPLPRRLRIAEVRPFQIQHPLLMTAGHLPMAIPIASLSQSRVIFTPSSQKSCLSLTAPYEAKSARTILVSVPIIVGTPVSVVPTIQIVDAPPSPSEVGEDVTFTVTLSGPSGVPTGTVTFSVNGIPIGGPCLPGTVSGAGVATCTITFNTPGPMEVKAEYSGDSVYAETFATLPHTVGQAVPTITITVARAGHCRALPSLTSSR